jgi:hypothetical protein
MIRVDFLVVSSKLLSDAQESLQWLELNEFILHLLHFGFYSLVELERLLFQ